MKHKYTKELLESLVSNANTWAEVCRKLGIQPATGAQTHVKKVCQKFGINFSHFVGNKFNKGRVFLKTRTDIQTVLVYGSKVQSHTLKQWLWREGLKKRECESCGLKEWLGKPAPLELDHINRDHQDNRLENLQILCPNCHAMRGTKQKGRMA